MIAWTFSEHPAFAAGIERGRQVALLRDLYAVMPYECRLQAAWVWTASLDPRAVEGARIALDEMSEDDRVQVITMARAIA